MSADLQEILRARAVALAREPARAEIAERMEVVAFQLAGERYGLAAEHVREVVALKDFSLVPCTPPFIVGIMNLRGQILTVVNIGRLFDLPDGGITDLNKVIILRVGGVEMGVVADAILGARVLRLDELQPSLPTLTGIRADYLRGVTADRLIVLDAARLLGDEALMVRDEVAL